MARSGQASHTFHSKEAGAWERAGTQLVLGALELGTLASVILALVFLTLFTLTVVPLTIGILQSMLTLIMLAHFCCASTCNCFTSFLVLLPTFTAHLLSKCTLSSLQKLYVCPWTWPIVTAVLLAVLVTLNLVSTIQAARATITP